MFHNMMDLFGIKEDTYISEYVSRNALMWILHNLLILTIVLKSLLKKSQYQLKERKAFKKDKERLYRLADF